MINGAKIASLVRPSSNLIIVPLDNAKYVISDTYIMLIMDEEEFTEFFSKYNSFKSTANIPLNFVGAISKTGDKFESTDVNVLRIIDKVEAAFEEVEITPFYLKRDKKKEARIYKVKDMLAIFLRKYDFLLELGDTYKAAGKIEPLFVCQDGEVKAIIMPVRYVDDMSLKDKIKELIA
ncbi:hypothetical protein [Halanaerobium sp. ST460_2HS_T2]|jgi:spore germination protein GerM|uniref:hypothetical protein n=1 Tax=Halanaerobium sp. ST460_2HS_T2 TaxID=2183914 RepID=UPI000DF437DB|nr:hypothetical protein [Halanaerobium sp. ST460_2HS_T2]RCW60964.1 hypothetical protein DFR80_106123 [Halanaerobium sp. ST460_2HS_T2]